MFNGKTFNEAAQAQGSSDKNRAGVQSGFYFVGHEVRIDPTYAVTRLNFEKRNGSEVLFTKTASVWHPKPEKEYRDKAAFEKAVLEFGKYFAIFATTYVDDAVVDGIRADSPKDYVEKIMAVLPDNVSSTEVDLTLVYKSKPFIAPDGNKVATTEVVGKTYGFINGRFMTTTGGDYTITWDKYLDKSLKKPVFEEKPNDPTNDPLNW